MANAYEDIARLSATLTRTTDVDQKQRLHRDLLAAVAKIPRSSTRSAEFDVEDDAGVAPRGRFSFKSILERPSRNAEEAELATFNDHLCILGNVLRRDPRETRYYHERLDDSPWLASKVKTMDTSTGGGWIPTEISADLVKQARLETVVASNIRQVTMPTPTFKLPLQGDPPKAHLVSEVSGPDDELDTSKRVPASDLGIGSAATLTAKKAAVRVVISTELNEESIVPMLDLIRAEIARAMAEAQENAIINAKRTGTLDSDVTDANDVRHWFDGIRQVSTGASLGNNSAVFAVGTAGRIELGDIRKLRAKLGRYGLNPADCFWLTGPSGYSQIMGLTDSLGNPLVVTKERFGDAATLVTGSIAALDGFGIVLSQFVPESANRFGYVDGITTDSTLVLLVNRRQFIWGDYRNVSLKSREVIETDEQVLVAMQRSDFVCTRPVPSAAGVPCGYLYDVRIPS